MRAAVYCRKGPLLSVSLRNINIEACGTQCSWFRWR